MFVVNVGTMTLLDNFTSWEGGIYIGAWTFDANDFDILTASFYTEAYDDNPDFYEPIIYMGSGTWSVGGGGFYVQNYGGYYVTVHQETSTVKMIGDNAGDVDFLVSDGTLTLTNATFYNLWIAFTGDSRIRIGGNETDNTEIRNLVFNQIKVDPWVTFLVNPRCEITTANWDGTGSPGNEITISSVEPVYGPIGDTSIDNPWRGYVVGDDLTLDGWNADAVIEVTSVSAESLGTEKVTNGSFTGSATGWSLSSWWSYNSDNIACNGVSTPQASQTFSVTPNTVYKITFTLSGGNSWTMRIYFNNSYFNVFNDPFPDGTYTYFINSWVSDTGQGIRFSSQDATPWTGNLDNVSIKELISHGGLITGYTVTTPGTGYGPIGSSYGLLGWSPWVQGYLLLDTIDVTTEAHTLTKSWGWVIDADYLAIAHSIATPSNTWYAGNNSIDNQALVEAGSWWIFSESWGPPPSDTASFLAFLM